MGNYLADGAAALGWKRKTLSEYERIVNKHIIPGLGGVKLTDLSPMAVEKFLRGMGPRSITQKTRKLLAQALARAQDMGLVETNAAERSRAPRYVPTPKRAFTLEQSDAVLGLMLEPYAPVVEMALYTGMRRGELLATRWEAISWDGEAPFLHVCQQVETDSNNHVYLEPLPKTFTGERDVFLLPAALAVLRRQRAALAKRNGASPTSGWVFPGESVVGTLGPKGLTEHVHAAVVAARKADPTIDPKGSLHSFRHVTASILLSAGVDKAQAAWQMGHTPAVFEKTYAEFLRPAGKVLLQRVTRFLAQQAGKRRDRSPGLRTLAENPDFVTYTPSAR